MSATLPSRWSTPDDVRAGLQRMWDQGRLLAARLTGEQLFPLELGLRQPRVAEMGAQFAQVQGWICALQAGSREAKGFGYDLVWRDINHRQLGRNKVPAGALVASGDEALRLIGRLHDARRFDQLSTTTLAAFPELRPWLLAQPLSMLDHAAEWPRILAILEWFQAHPQPALYVRQLDIPGVDSKFIESRKALLASLLDLVMPATAVVADAVGARQFERRYGLLAKPSLVRFRMLDPAHYIGGLSDLSVPVAQFVRMRPTVGRVYITENEVNALAFPDHPYSMVIFGGGYGVDRLGQVEWLREKEVFYWGDIDTHGFAILDRLRANLPHVRSVLMDSATLHAHRPLWGSEDQDKRYLGGLSRLTDPELALFVQLRDDVHGQRVRMEQERLGFGWVSRAISLA